VLKKVCNLLGNSSSDLLDGLLGVRFGENDNRIELKSMLSNFFTFVIFQSKIS